MDILAYFKKTIKLFIPKVIISLRNEYVRQKKNSNVYKNYEKSLPGNFYSLNAFDYYKSIFVHIPKAAGISVSKTLFGNLAGGHRTLKDYQNIYPKQTFTRYFKFTFVRNPYTRLYSAYIFLSKGGINSNDNEFKEKVISKYPTFESFVLNYLNEKTIYSYIHFIPQTNFLLDNNGVINLDYIGKFENIDYHFLVISKRLRQKQSLPHLNKSETKEKKLSLAKEVQEKIYSLYQKDFELLNYSPQWKESL